MGGVCCRALNLVIFIRVLSHLRFQCSPNLSVFEMEEIDFENDCIKNCTAVPKSGTTYITNYLQTYNSSLFQKLQRVEVSHESIPFLVFLTNLIKILI